MSYYLRPFLLSLVAYVVFVSADLVSFDHSDEFNAGEYGPWVLASYRSSDVVSPRVNMMKPFSACEDGSYLFIAPRGERADPMPYILDSNGSLIWTADRKYGEVYNFQSQIYRGQRYLTFWAGDDTYKGHGGGKYYMLDQHYQEYRQIEAVGEIQGDLHEFAITEDDTGLITVYEPIKKDVSSLRDDIAEGYIWESMFQELDLETGEALFTWRASDHIELGESYDMPNGDIPEDDPWDWFHINSIAKDKSGNYLVSSRYLRSTLYISGRTGDVLWRLGGKKNSFKDLSSGEATTFLGQHDARWDKTHKAVTLFDNRADWGNRIGDQSRGARIDINTRKMTAKLAQTYDHTLGNILSVSQGSYQTLPNGHVVLGYGVNGVVSEFSGAGELLCDAFLEPSANFGTGFIQSYRNFKLPWTGLPKTKPSLVLVNETFHMSWLGSTEVKSWVIRHSDVWHTNGTAQFHGMVKFDRDGFETDYVVAATERVRRWAHVVALDVHDQKLAVSDAFDVSLYGEFWGKHGLLENEEDLTHIESIVADEYYSPEDKEKWLDPKVVLFVAIFTIIFVFSCVHFGWIEKLRLQLHARLQQYRESKYLRLDARGPKDHWRSKLSFIGLMFTREKQEVASAERSALFYNGDVDLANEDEAYKVS